MLRRITQEGVPKVLLKAGRTAQLQQFPAASHVSHPCHRRSGSLSAIPLGCSVGSHGGFSWGVAAAALTVHRSGVSTLPAAVTPWGTETADAQPRFASAAYVGS